ncbi:uncharacterized protein LOC127709432 [Mytilus californianus]|uniref:uncharacterized protein LOC127709432 n=1 Tax=Mytilus californianus TaxID=6549 RepID=UPI0022465DB6|nr:uncharacterized protein LOC127709432 [Mytilus californianus]
MHELSKWSLFFHSILTLLIFKPDHLSAIHVSIQQDNALIMQCPRKTTINITAIYVENRQINCYCNGHGQCNLTLEESEYIRDTCNGNVSCGIDMQTMSIHDCLLEHGFYNFSNSCKPEVLECKLTKRGSEYRGIINTTRSNISCQRWDSQTPHEHTSNILIKDEANFCRNPDNEPEGPWCYTSDQNLRWEYCNVPFCDGAQYIVLECKLTTKGAEYNGVINKTRDNIACQRWDSDKPHDHSHTKSMKKEENFCRNPDNSRHGPWCYTTNSTIRWEYCNVSLCDFPHYVQTCIDVGNTMQLEKCPTVSRISDDFQIYFDRQLSDECSGNYSSAQAIVIDLCNKTKNRDICSESISRLLQDRGKCFEMNTFKVKYFCQNNLKETSTEVTETSKESVLVIGIGVAVGLLSFTVVSILLIIFIRRSFGNRKDIGLSNDNNQRQTHILNEVSPKKITTVKKDRPWNDSRLELKTRNQKYNGSVINKGYDYTDIENVLNTTIDVKVSPLNIGNDRCLKDQLLKTDYIMLDTAETGFNRSNEETINGTYELAKPSNISEFDNKIKGEHLDNAYNLSEECVYDTARKNRLKDSDASVYSHTVDDVYDTACSKITVVFQEDKYDHFTGQTTEDDYNITKH